PTAIDLIEGRSEESRIGGIMNRRILINDSVATTAGTANKSVDLLADRLLLSTPAGVSRVGGQSGAVETRTAGVRLRHELLDPCNEIRRTRRWIVRRQVVDGIVREDDVADISLRQCIVCKPILRTEPCPIAQQLIATDSLIEHADIQTGRDQAL